jgi:hypothetical protein
LNARFPGPARPTADHDDTAAAAEELEAAAKACRQKGLDNPAGALMACVKQQLRG